jgi:hypothetical protein
MRKLTSATLALGLTVALQGCAGVQTMETRDMNDAPSRTFHASASRVEAAAKHSMTTLGYDLESTKQVDGVTQIYFSKHITAFSWGEVGRVDVKAEGADSAKVTVGSEKRAEFQITGTTQNEFAENIFSGIESELKQ